MHATATSPPWTRAFRKGGALLLHGLVLTLAEFTEHYLAPLNELQTPSRHGLFEPEPEPAGSGDANEAANEAGETPRTTRFATSRRKRTVLHSSRRPASSILVVTHETSARRYGRPGGARRPARAAALKGAGAGARALRRERVALAAAEALRKRNAEMTRRRPTTASPEPRARAYTKGAFE